MSKMAELDIQCQETWEYVVPDSVLECEHVVWWTNAPSNALILEGAFRNFGACYRYLGWLVNNRRDKRFIYWQVPAELVRHKK